MSGDTTTIFLPYTLTLRAPAITTALSGDPNRAVTQPFIPGSVIRGAVAARLLAEGETANSDVFRDFVLTGAVRYLHAYPELNGQRAMLVPQSWCSVKSSLESVRDLAAFDGRVTEDCDAEDLADHWPDETLVSLGVPFTTPLTSSGARTVAAPRIDARLHQQRDRIRGRPWTDKVDGREVPRGAIFSYEYLEPEQVFRGLVQVHLHATQSADAHRIGELRDDYVQRLRALLDGKPILVGRARRAGYGGDAELQFNASFMDAEQGNIAGGLTADLESGTCFRLLLASAYVGRHPVTGQLDPTALVHELHQRGLDVVIERRYWSFETVGSFNRKWRLEVPQALAASAGSVFVLRAKGAVPVTVLRRIEREGLGERRVEGFGRVMFLCHEEDTKSLVVCYDASGLGTNHAADAAQAMDPSAADQLAFLERRIVRSAAKRELDRVAADIAGRASSLPTTSLLGRIRTLFRVVCDEATARQALVHLCTWCGEEGDYALKPEARKKLQNCLCEGGTLLTWFRALTEFDHDKREWSRLVEAAGTPAPAALCSLTQRHCLTTPDAAKVILDDHAAELTVYLIDGVLAAMARRNRGGNQ
ncbi:hypothetical protein DL240_15200 [Lujinxingia litoralis]|uniref:CRISPR-associated protein Csx10 n=1 Tax=Lujinxingia litoralis TaxID=2211119 RepID=A0A328C1Z4_9DELT|nr:RAMP superfamily CRISPR-associated protein [Lujinxingia litoralis]RAL20662.1 hypothetical protein DL240_15200 [Lujinxingia litoralis]